MPGFASTGQFVCDVVIVGAGPAGAAAAVHLARAGWRVILIDRQVFPRDKVCGDFLSPYALAELEGLGLAELPHYRSTNVIRRAALYLNGQQLIKQSLLLGDDTPLFGRVIPRAHLDGWIVDAARRAGARIVEDCQAIAFTATDKDITVNTRGRHGPARIRAKLVIGADGSTSTVARWLWGQPGPAKNRVIAVRAYFDRVAGDEDQADLFFNDQSFPGYCWIFPTGPQSANVGAGTLLETVPPTTKHLRDLLHELIETDPAMRARLRHAKMVTPVVGWPLLTFNPQLALVGPRSMLIGDAGGLINPLNGEGIQYALLSARWAAETAVACAAQNDFSLRALSTYSARVEREMRLGMAVCTLVVQAIRNKSLNPVWLWILRLFVERAEMDPDYANVAGGILAGLIPGEWGLAMVNPTIEQALLSFGVRVVGRLERDPAMLANLVRFGLQGIAEISRDVTQNSEAMLEWLVELALRAEELFNQTALQKPVN